MNMQFQSIIEAGVRRAKARKSVLWADDFARRIVSSTPLSVRESEISEQIAREAARAGVAIELGGHEPARQEAGCTAVC